METKSDSRSTWTFLTNHARVLSLIARDPDIRLRDIAATCRLTERAVQAIVADLEAAGYLTHSREGRRNRYRIMPDSRLRHPAEAGHTVRSLLELLSQNTSPPDDGSPSGDEEPSGDGDRAAHGTERRPHG